MASIHINERRYEKIIHSNNIMSRLNEIMRRLLSGLTDSELENLGRVRKKHALLLLEGPQFQSQEGMYNN